VIKKNYKKKGMVLMKYTECMIKIEKEVIDQELVKGKESMLDSEPLATTMPKSNRVKKTAIPGWGNSQNIYMKIKGTNMILLHVKDGKCIIVPEYVQTASGTPKSIIEHMATTYFTIDNDKNNVVSTIGINKKIYRQIIALKKYGNTDEKLPSDFEVHHKYARWLNTEEAMLMLNREQHSKIRNGQKSHRAGRQIDSTERLEDCLKNINRINEELVNRDNYF
jgi:hypothetical protein